MKKALALFLSILMLFGFGVIAGAEPPEESEEELQAQGRALLTQTMEDFKGDYTLHSYGVTIVHSNGSFAIIDAFANERYVYHMGKALRVWPDSKRYEELPDSDPPSYYTRYLASKEIKEDSAIAVEQT